MPGVSDDDVFLLSLDFEHGAGFEFCSLLFN